MEWMDSFARTKKTSNSHLHSDEAATLRLTAQSPVGEAGAKIVINCMIAVETVEAKFFKGRSAFADEVESKRGCGGWTW